MNNKDLVSIILPVYNSERTISQTIDSIISQTYDNYQLIIIDDNSNDNTYQVCKKYVDGINIEYYKLNKSGVSKARNFGLEKARGKYISFIDSDDVYDNRFLEYMVDKMESGNEWVTCGYQNFEKSDKIFLPNIDDPKTKSEYIKELQKVLLFNQIWNKMYLLDVIKKNNLMFREDISLAEDWEFNLEYLACIEHYTIYNKPLYWYRISDNGLGFRYRTDTGKIKLNVLDKMNKYFSLEENDLEFISNSYIKQYYACFSNIIDKRNTINFKEKREEIYKVINSEKFKIIIEKCKTNSTKNKILLFFLQKKNIFFIIVLSIMANKYDKIMKKIQFGL